LTRTVEGWALGALGSSLKRQIPGVRVEQRRNEGQVDQLTIVSRDAATKIEPNTILRGCVYPGETREMAASAKWGFRMALRDAKPLRNRRETGV